VALRQAIGAGTFNSSHVDNVLPEIDTSGLAPLAKTLPERSTSTRRISNPPVAPYEIAICRPGLLSVDGAAHQAKRIWLIVPLELLGH